MEYIKEGLVEITKEHVFYNEKMKKLRDISVQFVKVLDMKHASLLDATAASGIRGIRYKKEANVESITLLDKNKMAFNTMKNNVERNGIEGEIYVDSIWHFANSIHKKYDIIDLDPFGSPAPFIYDLMKIVHDKSILMVTATDMPVLCGVDKHACMRTYLAKPMHNYLCKESGARILLGFIARIASLFNFGIRPLLVISDMYYL